MPSKTRKQKITGVLGKGAAGTVYNARSTALSAELQAIESIELYVTNRVANVSLTEVRPFLTFLQTQSDIIVKTLTNKQSFLDELQENRAVIECYGAQATKYLTIAPLKGFRSLQITGALVKRTNGSEIYLIFGYRCDNQFDVRIDQLLVDLLESLVVLQKAKYLHNDIKLDNVVLCGNRYKFIDWGLSSPYLPFQIGNRFGTHPIKWYLRGIPPVLCVRILKLRLRTMYPSFSYSSLYSEVYNQIQREFKEVIQKPFSYEQLLATYASSFDIFMVGMMLLITIHTHTLDETRYLPVVKSLVSLKKPLSAAKALALVKRI
jgi:serine/threonine protein kinase